MNSTFWDAPLWRVAIAVVLVLSATFALPRVSHLSAVWESQANPREVTVGFEGGRTVKGRISHDWSGRRMLETAEGKQPLAKHLVVVYENEDRSFSASWRIWLPPFAVIALSVVIAFVVARPVWYRQRGAEHAGRAGSGVTKPLPSREAWMSDVGYESALSAARKASEVERRNSSPGITKSIAALTTWFGITLALGLLVASAL